MHKIGHSGEFLGTLLRPLLITGLPLMKNVFKSLPKSFLIPLRLAVAAVTGAAVQKRIFGSGMITMIILNEEVHDITKIVKSLEDDGLLIKVFSETLQNEAKKQTGGFLGMLLGTLGASLLGNLFIVKGVKAEILVRELIRLGEGTIRSGEGTIRVGQNFFAFEIQICY